MADEFGALLGDMALRSVVLLAVAALLSLALRRAAAATRHSVWAWAFACVLLMPLSQVVLSRWSVDVTSSALLAAVRDQATSLLTSPQPAITVSAPPTGGEGIPVQKGETNNPHVSLVEILVACWLLGVVIAVGRSIAAYRKARSTLYRARSAADSRLVASLDDARRKLGIRHSVPLLITDEPTVPFVFGTFRPVVLLPAASALWPSSRLDAVLLHELAHVRRYDAVVQLMVDVASAIQWFNPAIRLAASQLRREREQACDDMAVGAGMHPIEYADALVQLARSYSADVAPFALAAVRPSGLEQRVLAILDSRRSRTQSRIAVAMTAATVVIAQLALASLHAAETPADERQPRRATRIVAQVPTAPEREAPLPSAPEVRVVATPSEPTLIAAGNTVSRLATRDGVCGQGIPDEITFSRAPRPASEQCIASFVRIELILRDGAIVDAHAIVGGDDGPPDTIASGRDKALALLASVRSMDGSAAARAVQASALIANGATPAELIGLAQTESLATEARRMAVTWFDIVAGPSGERQLIALAQREGTDASVREQALIALGARGVSVALDIARTSANERMRRDAFHRAALQMTPLELAGFYPQAVDDQQRRRVVDGVAVSGDATARTSLLALIEREPESVLRAKSLERLRQP